MNIFTLDLLERTVWTFIQGFAAEWVITGSLDWQTLQLAALAGLVAVVKAVVLARNMGDENSAATLPSPPDHAAPTRITLPLDESDTVLP